MGFVLHIYQAFVYCLFGRHSFSFFCLEIYHLLRARELCYRLNTVCVDWRKSVIKGSWRKSKQYYSPAGGKLPNTAGQKKRTMGLEGDLPRLQLIGGS